MKQTDKNRAVVAEIISRASRETEMRAKLKAAPRATLIEAGVELDPDEDVVILENTNNMINAVLPPIALQDKFKGVLEQAAKRITEFPEGMELRIVRQSPTKFFIALPAEATDSPSTELTDEALEAVAGGKGGGGGGKTSNVTVQTQVTTTTTVAEVEVQVAVAAQAAVAAAEAVAVAVVIVPCFIS